MKRFTTTKTQISPFDSTKLAVHSVLRPKVHFVSKCGHNFEKTVSFNNIVHFIDEQNIVTYVLLDCRVTFYPDTPTKIVEINRERKNFSQILSKPKCIPSNGHITVLLTSRIPLISFWTRTFYGTWIQQLLCHSTTLVIGTLYPISTLRQQLTNLEQTFIRCFFHRERWTVKIRDFVSDLYSFIKVTYWTDEWTKQLLRLKIWVNFGSLEQWQWINFHRLWWTVVVFTCSYLF